MSWRLFKVRLGFAVYGLTHRKCWQCYGPKGLNLHRCCHKCQFQNLLAALKDAQEEEGDAKQTA